MLGSPVGISGSLDARPRSCCGRCHRSRPIVAHDLQPSGRGARLGTPRTARIWQARFLGNSSSRGTRLCGVPPRRPRAVYPIRESRAFRRRSCRSSLMPWAHEVDLPGLDCVDQGGMDASGLGVDQPDPLGVGGLDLESITEALARVELNPVGRAHSMRVLLHHDHVPGRQGPKVILGTLPVPIARLIEFRRRRGAHAYTLTGSRRCVWTIGISTVSSWSPRSARRGCGAYRLSEYSPALRRPWLSSAVMAAAKAWSIVAPSVVRVFSLHRHTTRVSVRCQEIDTSVFERKDCERSGRLAYSDVSSDADDCPQIQVRNYSPPSSGPGGVAHFYALGAVPASWGEVQRGGLDSGRG